MPCDFLSIKITNTIFGFEGRGKRGSKKVKKESTLSPERTKPTRRTSGDESRLRGSAHVWVKVALTHQADARHPNGQVARPFCAFLVHWFASWTANQNDQMARLTESFMSNRPKKADEDQLQPTVRNTLRKLSRPTNKNFKDTDWWVCKSTINF